MRKLLLATVAALGASMGVATVADAQTPTPAPGTVTVRLNGRFRFFAYYIQDRDGDNNASGTSTGALNAAGTGTATGANKSANYGFGAYARLYPGFDGVAANGLKYGASLEIRQDQNSGAGSGQYGSISAQNRARNTLYFRRLWGYIGADRFGTVRLGQVDTATSLYMTGNFENFNDGGLNGDVPGLFNQSTIITWPFADVGSYYTTNKAVYLSPQLYGFDFGVSFEPNTGTASINNGCGAGTFVGSNFVNAAGAFSTAAGANGQGVSGPGCDRLSSSAVNAESQRRRNTFDGLVRYRGTFGPVGVAATAAYITSSNVKDNSGVPFNRSTAAGATRFNYDGLNVGDFGAAITFAGLSVGGKYQFGRFTNQWNLVPRGLADGEAWLVGASYTLGPLVVGSHYLNYKSAGDLSNAANGRERQEHGVAAGATYSLAPGLSLFASYIWTQRRQNGYNFVTGQGVTAGNTVGNAFNNKVTGQLFALGTSFTW